MLWKRGLEWLAYLFDRRRGERHLTSNLAVYYWDGALPKAHSISDVSYTGAYLRTAERWYLGTVLMVTFQWPEAADVTAWITLPCEVVRHGPDGVGLKFMLSNKGEFRAVQRMVRETANAPLENPKNGASGQALVEFALMVPLVFLLVVNALNFGGFIYCWITIADAVRAGADYASTNGTTRRSSGRPARNATSNV